MKDGPPAHNEAGGKVFLAPEDVIVIKTQKS
jgi:hypothetical protein